MKQTVEKHGNVTVTREEQKTCWALELVTLGTIAGTALACKLIKDEDVKTMIKVFAVPGSILLAFTSLVHVVIASTTSDLRIKKVEVEGDNISGIMKDIFGYEWRSQISVEGYNYVKDNWEQNDRQKVVFEI